MKKVLLSINSFQDQRAQRANPKNSNPLNNEIHGLRAQRANPSDPRNTLNHPNPRMASEASQSLKHRNIRKKLLLSINSFKDQRAERANPKNSNPVNNEIHGLRAKRANPSNQSNTLNNPNPRISERSEPIHKP